jgi:hypothetical protein
MADDIHVCPCRACAGMRRRWDSDVTLLEFYAKRLLRKGWCGQMDDLERAYRRAHLSGRSQE